MFVVLESYGLYSGPNRRKHMMLCPFHAEKTPSMEIDGERSRYTCYSCGVYGNHIDFICEAEGVNHITAMRIYSAMCKGTKRQKITKQDLRPPIDPQRAIDKAHREFQMYMRTAWHSMPDHYMLRRGFTPATLTEFDVRHSSGQYGVIIPIYMLGTFCGHVKRKVSGSDDYRKYMYNEGFSRHTCLPSAQISDGIIITEGLLDYMKLHQSGYTSSCPVLGWKLSDFHAGILRQHGVKHAISALDHTETGERGTQHLIDLGFNVDRLEFPHGVKDVGEMSHVELLIAINKRRKLNYE